MKRRIIFILAGLTIVGAATFYYIDTVFLPIQFKRFITTRAEKFLQREVSIGAIDFNLLRGFSVENITVSRKDDPNRPFIQVKQVTFTLLIVPILKKRTIIIPSIKIKDPYIYLSRNENGIWNFSGLKNIKETINRKNPPSILFRKLDLEGGEIRCKDSMGEKEFLESIQNISINTTLSLNKGMRFVVKAQVPKRKTTLSIKGNYTLLTKKLTAQVSMDNLYLAQYLSLLHASRPYIYFADGVIPSADFSIIYKNHNLQIQGAFAANKTDLRIGKDKRIAGAIHVQNVLLIRRNQRWHAQGQARLPSVHITIGENKEFRGDIDADLNLLTFFNNNIIGQGNVTIDNARLIIDKDKHFSGNIKATNVSLAKQSGSIRLLGNFDIKKTDVAIGTRASLKGDLSTIKTKMTWSPDGNGAHKFSIQSGLKMNNARIALGKNMSISGNINLHKANIVYDQEEITIEARGQINETSIRLAKNRQFQGNPYFNIFCQYDTRGKSPVDYKGTISFEKSLLTGVPYLEKVSNIKGVVAIMPDHIQTDGLSFNTQETNVKLSGLLTDFSKPTLNIKASSENIDIRKVLSLFPSLQKKIKVDATGQAAVNASYSGPALSPSKAIIKLKTQLTDVTIAHEKFYSDITGISGQLNYEEDLIVWNNITANYKEESYVLNGQLRNFSRPTVDATITAKQLELATQIKILHSAFRITSLTGGYLNSTFDLKGDAHFFKDAEADIDLRGKFVLDLKDLAALIPRLKNRVKQFKPTGVLTGEGIYRGKLKDWRDWQIAFDAESDKLTLKDYLFENTSIRFAQRDRAISKFNISSKIYGGKLEIASSADLRGEDVLFDSAINLKDLDLALFRKNRNLKNHNLSGKVTLLANLEGTAKKWRETIGRGSLNITDGYLWRWKILDGMSAVLLIPEFKNFVFTEAYANFILQDQKILTRNARMTSKSVILDVDGWININGDLNFNISPTFSKLAILRSESLKKGPTSILTQTKGYLNIRLTGTLDEPRLNIEKFPLKIIEETIGETADTIKGVIGGIVEGIF